MKQTMLKTTGAAKSFTLCSDGDIHWFGYQDWGDTAELLSPRLFSQDKATDEMKKFRITIEEVVETPEEFDLSFVPTGD